MCLIVLVWNVVQRVLKGFSEPGSINSPVAEYRNNPISGFSAKPQSKKNTRSEAGFPTGTSISFSSCKSTEATWRLWVKCQKQDCFQRNKKVKWRATTQRSVDGNMLCFYDRCLVPMNIWVVSHGDILTVYIFIWRPNEQMWVFYPLRFRFETINGTKQAI